MMKARQTPLLKRPIIRILLIWGIETVALLLMAWIMDRVMIASVTTAVLAVAVIGLLNAFLWPLLSRVLLPFAVLTLGIVALMLNGLIVYLSAILVQGFTVTDFWAAFWLSLGMAAINIILSSLLTIDDDNSWTRHQVRRRMQRSQRPQKTDVPGVIFLEIDGLAEPIFHQAMADGYMPTLKSWVDNGSHVITPWETDTSSQTSAGQAGILHGNNCNIPAFRWYDKETKEIIASSNTKFLPLLEKRHSDGNGLLVNDGASRGNLLSGDAPHVMATASTITDRTKFHTSEFQAYFTNPYNTARTLLLFLWDIILEKKQFRSARKNKVEPILERHHRAGIYPLIRATMTVIMRELNIYTLVGDMFAGRSSAYATFVGYDEIAHHSGIYDEGAFDILHKLDQQIARLAGASASAPRPYHLVVLSDHGQTNGATFRQRYGQTLDEFVQALMTAEHKVQGTIDADDDIQQVNVLLTDTIHNESSWLSRLVARLFRSRMRDGEVTVEGHEENSQKHNVDAETTVIVLASGNLGLISFTRWDQRMTLEEIDEAFPAVVPGLVAHEGVGFVMVRSEEEGAVVIGKNGRYYLKDDRIEGENPLAFFGPHAAHHLRRTDSFSNCPDILVNSFYDPIKDEGCAFEELIGFHGGLGGLQTQPFLLHPVELPVEGELIGAAAVYKTCKGWLNQLHHVEPETV